MKRSRAIKAAAAAAAAVLVAGSTALAGTSEAHNLSGNLNWSLGTHDTLGTGSLNAGDQVGLWQSYLLAYNIIPCTGLDGHFGPQTSDATKAVQGFFVLNRDGVVGDQTWAAASSWMDANGSNGTTTFWKPHNVTGSYHPMYTYKAGGAWTWEVPTVTTPFEQDFSTSHPAITFGRSC